MAEARDILSPDNAVNVLEEILEAQNQAYLFGLKLHLPLHTLDAIYSSHSQPRDRLLQVIIEFLKQVEPRPTWRAIVAVLRDPVVNLPQLAMRVEAAHFPDPTASRDAPSENTNPISTRPEAISHTISTETSSSLCSDEMDTGGLAALTVEAAHFPHPTATHDAPQETSTLNVTRSEATSGPETSSTQTSASAAGVSSQSLDTSDIGSDTALFVPPISAIGVLASKPTLPAFLSFTTSSGSTINIVQQIGTHHSTLGPLLLNDEMGAVTSTIVTQHHQNADAINQEILSRWLQGQGKQPVTWSTITDVLRDVGLPELTKTIQEGLKSSNTSSIQTSVSPSGPTVQPPNTEQRLGTHPSESHLSTATDHKTLQQVKQVSHQQGQMTIQYIQAKIRQLEKRFNALKKSSRECLERLRVPVKRVADALTSLPADDVDEHKQFLESHLSALYHADDHSELFGTMNFHWNYQNYQLLDHVICEFDLEGVKGEMKTYKDDLHQFRKKTPLKLFCESHKKRRIKPPPDFHDMVAEFDWPDDVTLDVVEEFRQEYACHYSLQQCAMMLVTVRPGSFIITWFIPASIVEKLKVKVPIVILKKYLVTKLEIAGECVYPKFKNEMCPSSNSSPTSAPATESTLRGASHQSAESLSQISSTEQKYHFVEQLSEDFYCPVTFNLLLQPHLTECCGKHISKEAAMRIQGEGGACPLCKEPHLNTMLDKNIRRQVNELRVFCNHEDRGCGWQGQLSDLEHHVHSCSMYSGDVTGHASPTSLNWNSQSMQQSTFASKSHYHNIFIDKSLCLGAGAYGTVYRAKCDELPCAAKVMHGILSFHEEPGALISLQKYYEACELLSMIHNPNIVQYLVTFIEESGHPVLLMELCDESLTTFLERSPEPLPYHIQLNICHDIALALVYLHSNGLIHRDLTSNNVLMNHGKAKVTDFGMSKLTGIQVRPTTKCPGNPVYMPPEAFTNPPHYTEKLDIFSFGVLVVQIITRKFPSPKYRYVTKLVPPSEQSPNREILPEESRRHNHLVLIGGTHPMKLIALQCLSDKQEKRDTAKELSSKLFDLKNCQRHHKILEVNLNQCRQAHQKYVEKCKELDLKKQEEFVLEITLSSDKVKELHRKLKNREMAIEEQERMIAESEAKIHSLERELESAQQDLKRAWHVVPKATEQGVEADMRELRWEVVERSPVELSAGSAMIIGENVYIASDTKLVYCYNRLRKWSILPECDCERFSLAVVDGSLVTVGGWDGEYTNKLVRFTDQRTWNNTDLPAMPTPRAKTITLSTDQYLIAAGGYSGTRALDTVEVLTIQEKQWMTCACSLPHIVYGGSMSLIDNQIYLAPRNVESVNSQQMVLTCKLSDLKQPKKKSLFGRRSGPWQRVKDLPVPWASVVAMNGRLLAIGGKDSRNSPTYASTTVWEYTPTQGWKSVSQIPNGRWSSISAILPRNQLIVVGGVSNWTKTNFVEIASL